MSAMIIHWLDENVSDIRILTDKGGCKLLFNDQKHAEQWVLDNRNKVDDFYKIVDIGGYE